jgi:hypothetical protein
VGHPLGRMVVAGAANKIQPAIASNGQQALIAWEDYSAPFGVAIRSARIGMDGNILESAGAPVTISTVNAQSDPVVAASRDQFMVVWVDQRDGGDIYGARFTKEGQILDPSGIPVSVAPFGQTYVSLTSNGTDFFAIWSDSRNFGFWQTDIYGARITANGAVIDRDGIRAMGQPTWRSGCTRRTTRITPTFTGA